MVLGRCLEALRWNQDHKVSLLLLHLLSGPEAHSWCTDQPEARSIPRQQDHSPVQRFPLRLGPVSTPCLSCRLLSLRDDRDCSTVMISNISPCDADFDETIRALK